MSKIVLNSGFPSRHEVVCAEVLDLLRLLVLLGIVAARNTEYNWAFGDWIHWDTL